MQAYEEMKNGKNVARTSWNHPDDGRDFCMLSKNINFIVQVRSQPSPAFSSFQPLIEDFDADDWFVKETSVNGESKETVLSEVLEVTKTV